MSRLLRHSQEIRVSVLSVSPTAQWKIDDRSFKILTNNAFNSNNNEKKEKNSNNKICCARHRSILALGIKTLLMINNMTIYKVP